MLVAPRNPNLVEKVEEMKDTQGTLDMMEMLGPDAGYTNGVGYHVRIPARRPNRNMRRTMVALIRRAKLQEAVALGNLHAAVWIARYRRSKCDATIRLGTGKRLSGGDLNVLKKLGIPTPKGARHGRR